MSEYLLARSASRLFAIDLGRVDEVLAVPALSPLAQTPSFVAGAFQLGSATVAVLDVSRRLGLDSGPITAQQQVVVGAGLGLLFDEVVGLSSRLASLALLPDAALPGDCERFVQGMAGAGELGVALVLDWDRLARLPEVPGELAAPPDEDPQLAERARLYRDRALDVAVIATEDPLLLLQLGPERALAIHSKDVHEVAPLSELCPVPGCPPFVAGVVALRGELYLALDLRPGLGLPSTTSHHFLLLRDPPLALVGERVTDLVVGPVQPPDPILPALPDSMVVSGCLAVGSRLVPVLNVEATFARSEWLVDLH